MKRNILRALIIIVPTLLISIPLILCVINIVGNNRYNEGKLPVKEENKYFIQVKDNVFTEAIKEDNSILSVINSSKNKLQLCPANADNTDEYMNIFFGSDSLAQKTIELFKDRGFEWVINDSILGTYFSLPREMYMNDSYDYVTVPVWLVKELLDKNILDEKKVFVNNDEISWYKRIANSIVDWITKIAH